MVEAKVDAKKPEPKAPPKPADPNVVNRAEPQPVELTPEEKKVKAEYKKLNEEGSEKAAKINARLIEDDKPQRVKHEVRNGELVYIWINEVPVRIMSEEELKFAAAVK